MRVGLVLVLVLSHMACQTPKGGGNPATPAVLITGASSGIGRAATEHLARAGYHVYAGARKTEDLKALDSLPNVKGVRLDVTVPEQIEAAARLVASEGRPFVGLVNNAGIAVVGPMTELPAEEVARQLEVNVLGPYRVTQAFAPMLIKHQGRVVNIGSLNGVISGGFYGPYAMSKHALHAYSESLAQELGPRGVKVVTVIPGGYQSRIFEQLLAEGWVDETEFRAEMDRYIDQVSRRPARPPAELAPTIQLALEDPKPGRRLYPGLSTQEESDLLMRVMVFRLAQLNSGHPHGHSREQLIELLDKALERYPGAAPSP